MTDADGNEDFEEYEDVDDDGALSPLGESALALCEILIRETHVANNGGLNALSSAVRAKRGAWEKFRALSTKATQEETVPGYADREALKQLVAAAKENALILEAVQHTINDFAGRLRVALTSAADPGVYGPKGKGPRHALAARFDSKI
jgi:hypothetical protein